MVESSLHIYQKGSLFQKGVKFIITGSLFSFTKYYNLSGRSQVSGKFTCPYSINFCFLIRRKISCDMMNDDFFFLNLWLREKCHIHFFQPSPHSFFPQNWMRFDSITFNYIYLNGEKNIPPNGVYWVALWLPVICYQVPSKNQKFFWMLEIKITEQTQSLKNTDLCI